MQTDPPPAQLGKTIEQLSALDEVLQGQITALARQRAEIQAELQRRNARPVLPMQTGSSPSGSDEVSLGYLTPEVALAATPDIGDPYADHARRYAMRATMIAFGLFVAVVIGFCVLAKMT